MVPVVRVLSNVIVVVVVWLWLVKGVVAAGRMTRVALHAQVPPSSGKVVGSVMTTSGICQAMRRYRSGIDAVEVCEVFYPFQYKGFLSHAWDLVIIEGWFPSIIDFIQLARGIGSLGSEDAPIVLFYCLDPSYPGLSIVQELPVDGFLTNSQPIYDILVTIAPTKFLLLAADEDYMAPASSSRQFPSGGVVYVGAGGGMTVHKKHLLTVLRAAKPFGLRIYGSNWNEIPEFSDVWFGPLPQQALPEVYASAGVILAMAVDSQRHAQMINNRVFEALSCGGVVVSDYSEAVYKEFGGVLNYVNVDNSTSTDSLLIQVQSLLVELLSMSENEVSLARTRARAQIMSFHTWQHRVVDIFQFYRKLRFAGVKKFSSLASVRSRHWSDSINAGVRLKLLLIVDDDIRTSDYAIIDSCILAELKSHYYNFTYMNSSQFLADFVRLECSPSDSCHKEIWSKLSTYSVLFAVATGFSSLDISLRNLPIIRVQPHNILQRRAMYVLGINTSILSFDNVSEALLDFTAYDVIWFRSYYEIRLFLSLNVTLNSIRIQQVFGFCYNLKYSADMSRFLVESEFEAVEGKRQEISDDVRQHTVVCFADMIFECMSGLDLASSVSISGSLTIDRKLRVVLINANDAQQSTSLRMLYVKISPNRVTVITPPFDVVSFASLLNHMAETVFFCHSPPAHDALSATLSHVHIWPLAVAVAVDIPIILTVPNDPLVEIGREDGENQWTMAALDRNLAMGASRMFGFGPSQSKVTGSVKYVARQETEEKTIDEVIGGEGDVVVVLSVQFDQFIPGLDGQFCVEAESWPRVKHESSSSPSAQLCLIVAAVKHIRFMLPTSVDRWQCCRESADEDHACVWKVKFVLRGSMFFDDSYVWSGEHDICELRRQDYVNDSLNAHSLAHSFGVLLP